MTVEGILQARTGASDDAYQTSEADLVQRRRGALMLFQSDPQAAAEAFPDLLPGLRSFFLTSTNPFADYYDNGKAMTGCEVSFNDWNRARDWAGRHEPDATIYSSELVQKA